MERPSYVSRFYIHLEVNEHFNFSGKIAPESYYSYLISFLDWCVNVARTQYYSVIRVLRIVYYI
jgi:hypothetical protein